MKTLAPDLVLGIIQTVDTLASPLPLEHTYVEVQIIGPTAAVTITQRFRNPLTAAADLEYLFPLPHKAAISEFELCIGERKIQSKVEELKQAQRTFEKARRNGHRAALLDERRRNLFGVQLANVQPGEYILAVVRYYEPLAFRDNEFEFVFPMGLTPKYHSPEHPLEAQGVNAPVAENNAEVGPIEINLDIDPGLPVNQPTSRSHPLHCQQQGTQGWVVQLDGLHLPDRDFILRYSVQAAVPCLAARRSPAENGDYFLLSVLPPRAEVLAELEAREFVFVLDRSGSMSGEPITQAINALRACLRTLNPDDQFYILLFDDRLEWYRKHPSLATQETVSDADRYLDRIDGRGGTEIVGALQAALHLPTSSRHRRTVVFITDGAVSAEQRALEQTQALLGSARLFTFGIGPSVNRALLEQLAQVGRGAAEFIGLEEDIEQVIIRFQDRISFPALTDLELEWENSQAWDIYPSNLPDLYMDQPLLIVGRLKAGKHKLPHVQLSGKRGEQILTLSLDLTFQQSSLLSIERMWAAARLDELLWQETLHTSPAHNLRAEIISLAMAFHLLTPYTALVAIDTDPSIGAKAAHKIQVAQPLPQGLEIDGFFGAAAPVAPLPAQSAILSSADLDIPTFLRSRKAEKAPRQSVGNANKVSSAAPQQYPDPKETLKLLARTQDMNGAWNQDVEYTALALLAFLRSGHTVIQGHYRKQIKRALEWLASANAVGLPAMLRALVFFEAAEAMQSTALHEPYDQIAKSAIDALPPPATNQEAAVYAILRRSPKQMKKTSVVNSLEELKLAVATNTWPTRIASKLWSPPDAHLGRIMLAALTRKRSQGG